MNKHIHIVCPEIPLPSSSSDMADTYFQLQLLHQAGYEIILHCFHNAADPDITQVEPMTSCVHLYARNKGHKGVSMRYPYCISSRSNPRLLENILQKPYPVLFQGTATTFFLPNLVARGYKTYVRINGIASALYETSLKCEKSLLKKIYSFNEARLIKRWEEKIARQSVMITTTLHDQQQFRDLYAAPSTKYLAPLIPYPEIKTSTGTGMYCLYYGDMSNAENEKMAHWLSDVFSKMQVPLIVADTCRSVKEPDPAHLESNICMISNPDETALKELIRKAQVVLLPRSHNNGFDKRLLLALETGRHCICNDLMIKDTALEKLFITANGCDEFTRAIHHYFSLPFTHYDVNERTHLLSTRSLPHESLQDFLTIIEA